MLLLKYEVARRVSQNTRAVRCFFGPFFPQFIAAPVIEAKDFYPQV
jgi:D-alanyl-lipoteichoic acid acyltransferase DltB (MBOAT superfamily)